MTMLRAVLVLVLLSAPVHAEEPAAPPPEVQQRFARAVESFNRGDTRAAQVEFERIHATHPRPGVSFNLALVYVALGEPARAVALFDEVIAAPGRLPADRVARAKELRAQQAALLGELAILVPVEGAELEVEGSKVGRSPLPTPVKVKAGEVTVGAVAPKYAPLRSQVAVPAGGRREVTLELLPLDKQPAQLKVHTATPAAELFVDGKRIARAPFASTFALEPGAHRVELRREGFRSAGESLTLGEGTSTEWERDLEEDTAALAHDGGEVLIVAKEEGAVQLTVDGKRRGLVSGPVRLVPGEHELVLERGGFYPEVRRLNVAPSLTERVEVSFEPTPELRGELERTRSRHLLLGIGGAGLGGAALVGGAVYLGVNARDAGILEKRITDLQTQAADPTGQSECLKANNCQARIEQAKLSLTEARTFATVGWVSVVVGGVLTGFGVWQLVTAPDPSRYDRPSSGVLLDSLSLAPAPGGGLVSLGGRF